MIRIFFSFLIALSFCQAAMAYSPPTGIPAPMWGSYDPINTAIPSRPSSWTSEQAGYYYVDSTSGCSDTNTYGHPGSLPGSARCSIPATLAAGAYVEFTGTHAYTRSFNIPGTEANPVHIVGVSGSTPTVTAKWDLGNTSYLRINNVLFTSKFDIDPNGGNSGDHIAIMNSEVAGNGTLSNLGTIPIYGSATEWATQIVFYNVDIHDGGDDEAAAPNDIHGIKPVSYVNDVWILESEIYNCGGDSVQVADSATADEIRPYNIFIGGNDLYHNGENGIDIKNARNMIISGNKIHNSRHRGVSGGGNGVQVVLHDSCDDIWVINNEIYDGEYGVVQSNGANTNIIGNTIYNIKEYSTENHTVCSPWRYGTAIQISAGSARINYNTIYDVNVGISLRAISGNTYDITGNIITALVDTSQYASLAGQFIAALDESGGDLSLSTVDYNLFYDSSFSMCWESTAYNSVSAYETATSKCADCVSTDPILANPPTDFSIPSNSPAVNSGESTAPAIVSTLFSAFGLYIDTDYNGTARPQNSVWDIGAYEYKAGATLGAASLNGSGNAVLTGSGGLTIQ